MRKNILSAAIAAVIFILSVIPCTALAQPVPGNSGEEWMGVYLGGKKVGYAATITKEVPGGYEVREELKAVLSVMGFRQEIRMETDSRLSGSLALEDVRFLMDAGVARTSVNGKMTDRTLSLNIDSGGGTQSRQVEFKEPPFISSSLSLFLSKQDLKKGSRFSLPYFDPATLSQERINIEIESVEDMKVGEKVVPVFKIKEDYAGIDTYVWFSREAGTIKGTGPMGFTFVRETKEQAIKPPDGGYRAGDIIAMASIPADVDIPAPDRTMYLKAKLKGGDFSGLDVNGGRQSFSGGVVEVSREGLNSEPVKLPVKNPAMAAYLKPEPYIESDSAVIKQKAEEIAGGEKDVLSAARKIAEWVNRSVMKKPSAGIPDAVEVLRDLSGDCNEHTVLFTALARAAGVPARMDAGIVMVGDRFYYHAWPEVWAGKWIAIDPTFGQFPADATHIRLEEGGLDRQVRIMKLMGKMKVEILEYRAE